MIIIKFPYNQYQFSNNITFVVLKFIQIYIYQMNQVMKSESLLFRLNSLISWKKVQDIFNNSVYILEKENIKFSFKNIIYF